MIEAMKQWLEALETAWYHVGTFAPTDDAIELYNQAKTSLHQAIAEAEKQEQDKPVGWIDSKGNMLCVKINESCRPLYTYPQPRKPLTDEQIEEIADGYLVDYRIPAGCAWNFARDIEAAHGIKE